MSKKIANQAGYSLMMTSSGVRRWQKTGGDEPGRAGDAGSATGDFGSSSPSDSAMDPFEFSNLEKIDDSLRYGTFSGGEYSSFADYAAENLEDGEGVEDVECYVSIEAYVPEYDSEEGEDILEANLLALESFYPNLEVEFDNDRYVVPLEKAMNDMESMRDMVRRVKNTKVDYAVISDSIHGEITYNRSMGMAYEAAGRDLEHVSEWIEEKRRDVILEAADFYRYKGVSDEDFYDLIDGGDPVRVYDEMEAAVYEQMPDVEEGDIAEFYYNEAFDAGNSYPEDFRMRYLDFDPNKNMRSFVDDYLWRADRHDKAFEAAKKYAAEWYRARGYDFKD